MGTEAKCVKGKTASTVNSFTCQRAVKSLDCCWSEVHQSSEAKFVAFMESNFNSLGFLNENLQEEEITHLSKIKS